MTKGFEIENKEHRCQNSACGVSFQARCRPGVVKYCPKCRETRKKQQAHKHNLRRRKLA